MIWHMEAEPPFNLDEIRRYMRLGPGGGNMQGVETLLRECLADACGLMKREVCYAVYPVHAEEGGVDLTFARVRSYDLARALSGCGQVVLFAATAGFAFDAAIARAQAMSEARGLVMHAIGAERVEALCDAFCGFIQQTAACRGLTLRPRFSPGYGDLPLSFQTAVAGALEMEKIGIVLGEGLLMRPSKSVTALIGLAGKDM